MTKTFILLALAVGLGLGFFISQTGVFLNQKPDLGAEINQESDLKDEVKEEKRELDATTPDVVKNEDHVNDSVVANEPNVYSSKLFSLRYPNGWRQTNSEGLSDLLIKGSVEDLIDPRGIFFVSPDASYVNQKDGEITKGNVLSVYYSFTSTQGLGYYDLSVLRSQDAKYTNQYRYEVIVVDGHNMIITNDPGFDDGSSYPHSLTAYTVDDEFEYSFVFETPNNKDPREWELFKSILQTVRFK